MSKNYLIDTVLKGKVDFLNLSIEDKKEVFTQLVLKCHMCPLWRECKAPLPPHSIPKPKAIFIGTNPGIREDTTRQYFPHQYPSGSVFEKYLKLLKLNKDEVYLTNAVFCHTGQQSPPVQENFMKCIRWKLFEFSLIEIPQYIFVMSNYALRMFMGLNYPSILAIQGDIYEVELMGKSTYLVPICPPAYLLRDGANVWRKNTQMILSYVENKMSKE